jgi:hypothetical protein
VANWTERRAASSIDFCARRCGAEHMDERESDWWGSSRTAPGMLSPTEADFSRGAWSRDPCSEIDDAWFFNNAKRAAPGIMVSGENLACR